MTLSLWGAFTDETSFRYMLKLAGPMVVTTMSFTVMQFVDRLMVSRLGTAALAAIVVCCGFCVLRRALRVTTFVSRSLGRGEKKDCSNYCWQAIYLGLVYFVIVVAIMWPSAAGLFRVLGHEPKVAEMEVIYLRIMLYAQVVAVFSS